MSLGPNDLYVSAANGIQMSTGTSDIVFSVPSGKEVKVGGNFEVTGSATFQANLVSGNASTPMTIRGYGGTNWSQINFTPNSNNLNIKGELQPYTDATYAIGDASYRWTNLFLSGTGYIPTANVNVMNANTANITAISAGTLTLVNALATSSGGTGLQSFTANGVFYAGSSSTMNFATGSPFQVMQLNSLGVPAFAGLDGGQF
jgi:hypothetical protein